MTATELVVILLGLFAGYWVVGKLFFPGKPTSEVKPATPLIAVPSLAAPIEAWHETLQIAPDASVAEIEQAYRSLIVKYQGAPLEALSDELKSLAATKAREIELAYHAGRRARGVEP
jgi:DnaJ-domain-containing protein 1